MEMCCDMICGPMQWPLAKLLFCVVTPVKVLEIGGIGGGGYWKLDLQVAAVLSASVTHSRSAVGLPTNGGNVGSLLEALTSTRPSSLGFPFEGFNRSGLFFFLIFCCDSLPTLLIRRDCYVSEFVIRRRWNSDRRSVKRDMQQKMEIASLNNGTRCYVMAVTPTRLYSFTGIRLLEVSQQLVFVWKRDIGSWF
ncbi:hypothetical protein L6452_06089 [Arctium lappa]|uniref:Uncharacterized protein n=1 Tax=Arctium lappa TaxID=4217 RepID=A0ACB9EHW5_ARCLA|nr:hypothetical protein L6452_06089 [Arctium lappa]